MSKAGPSTRNKVNTRPSLPTRQQPTRACKRAAADVGFYSSKPAKRARIETSDVKTKQTLGHRSRRVHPTTPNDLSDHVESSTRQQVVTNPKRKQPIADENSNGNGCQRKDTESLKRRRLRSAKEDPSSIPEKSEPKPWQLPLELLYMIYDYFWDPETFECSSPKTLHSCALTCSYWRDAVRPYIFRFITLDSTEKIEKFAMQVHDEPQVAQWVRKIRLEGKTLPWHDRPRRRLKNVEQDIDQWLYAFPTVLDAHFPYLKTFELFNFAQVSPRLEDREAFVRWIPELKALESVTTLNILRCEMSSNNLTALVCALPRLTRTDFVDVNFTHPNWAILCAPAPNDSHTEWPRESFTEPTELLQVRCPVLYPPPSLQAFRLDNSHALYNYFKLDLLRDWFRAETSAPCLKSLELSGRTDETSLRDFIYALRIGPNLSHLQVPIGPDVDIIDSGMDISHLINLTSIRFMGCDNEWGTSDIIVDVIHLFLYQLNAPGLREVAIAVRFQQDSHVAAIATIDRVLADAKFNTLEVVRIELHPTSLKGLERKVKKNFPLTAKRGILQLEFTDWDRYYLKDTLGMT